MLPRWLNDVISLPLVSQLPLIAVLVLLGYDRGYFSRFAVRIHDPVFAAIAILSLILYMGSIMITVGHVKREAKEAIELQIYLMMFVLMFRTPMALFKVYVPVLSPLTLAPVAWTGIPCYLAYVLVSQLTSNPMIIVIAAVTSALLTLTVFTYVGFAINLRLFNARIKKAAEQRKKIVRKMLSVPNASAPKDYIRFFEESSDKEAALRAMRRDLDMTSRCGDFQLADVIAKALEYAERRLWELKAEKAFNDVISMKAFSNVVGLEKAKEVIAWKFLIPLLRPEKAPGVGPRLGVLLYGPPGVGKSELARELANTCRRWDLGIQVLTIKPEDANKPFVGEDVEALTEILNRASAKPSVVIIDEAVSVLGRRQFSDSRHRHAGFETILQKLDSVMSDRHAKLLILVCTNRPDLIEDAALRPGRIGEKIYVPPPDRKARMELFRKFLSDKPVEGGVDYEKLANLTEPNSVGHYSGDDIREICRDALVEACKKGREAITMADLEAAVAKRPPSINAALLAFYDEYRRRTEAEPEDQPKRPSFYG